MSEARKAEDVRKDFLDHIAHMSSYWSRLPDKSPLERCNGLAFSILTLIDGSGELPAMDLILRPHPDDERFYRDEGEDFYLDGQVINDTMLHEMWGKHEIKDEQ